MTSTKVLAPLALAILFTSTAAAAQNDVAAGLFTEAGKVPLAAQSLAVDVVGDVATVVLKQTFANTAADVRQADYRLVLPRHASVLGFGFYNDDTFLEAALKEKGAAEAAHRRAAKAGRATGLLRHDTVTHSFSVFPLRPGERKRVVVRMHLPVVTAGGTSSVDLPIALFAGQSQPSSSAKGVTKGAETFAPPQSPIVARVMASQELASVRLRGASTALVVEQEGKFSTVVGSANQRARLEWSESSAPVAVSATEVDLPDGKRGLEIAVAFSDLLAAKAAHQRLKGAQAPADVRLLVDGSASMRGHRGALAKVLSRTFAIRPQTSVTVVGEDRSILLTDGKSADEAADVKTLVDQALDGRAGHRLTRNAIRRARKSSGCNAKNVRCVLVTDGQLEDLEWTLKAEWPSLILADADAADREKVLLASNSKANVFIEGATPLATLPTLVDELLLPALDVTLASYGPRGLKFEGRPKMRIAEGAQRRFVARLPKKLRKRKNVVVDVTVAGKTLALTAPVERVNRDSVRGVALRKRIFKSHLDDLLRLYDRKPKERLRKDIVALSLRENIPTRLTAWHVEEDAPRARLGGLGTRGRGLAGEGRRGLGGHGKKAGTYRKRTVIDFEDSDIRGDLVKPSGGMLGVKDAAGAGGLGLRGYGSGGGGGIGGLSSVDGLDTGGGGAGLGSGAGKGRGRVRARAAMVTGSVSKSSIARVFRRNTSRIRYCYEKSLKSLPKLSGKLVVEVVIGPNGRVREARAKENTLEDATTVRCILRMVKRMRFPKPAGGGEVKVSFPFIFRSATTGDDD